MLRRVAVMLVLGSVMLAACGGDDGGSSGDGTDTGAGGGGATGVTSATGATGATTAGDGGVAGVIGSAECAEVAAAMAAAAQGSSAIASGSGSDLEQSLQQMEAFAEAVPDEIKADVETVLAGYRAYIEAIQDSGWDPASGEAPPPEVIAELEQVSQEFSSEEFQAASERVNAYFASGCQA